MTQMSKLSEKDFKTDIINRFKQLKENIGIMSEHIKTILKNQVEI